MDSISSHRTGVVTAQDQGEYMRRGEVAGDRVLGRVRCLRKGRSTVSAAKGPRSGERLVSQSVLLMM